MPKQEWISQHDDKSERTVSLSNQKLNVEIYLLYFERRDMQNADQSIIKCVDTKN